MPTLLAFGAHPDEIEIGCGGTVRRLIQRGRRAVHVCVTSGEAGSSTIDQATLAATREQEIAVIDLIREVRQEILFVHASSDAFLDHRVVHELVMNAVAGAAGPWYQQASGEPHQPTTILGYEVWHPLTTHYDQAFLGLARYRGVMAFCGCHAEVFEVLRTPLSLPAGLA